MDIVVGFEEYIDVNDALKRIGGNMDLYKRLLGRFVGGNHYETLESALRGGDLEEASRLAHTLKGVSANLSLVKVRAITADLELIIKDGHDHSVLLAELKNAYEETSGKIAMLVS